MSNRNLTVLAIAAAAMVAWAVVQSRISNRPPSAPGAAAYLIQGLDPDHIASITIGTGNEQVILTRRGADFVVASKDNYPVLTSEINKLITTCLDIQTSELYTDNPANHKDLGVTEQDARVLVKFYKADSSLLTGVVIGKPRERGRDGGYVRRAEDNKVYVTAEQIPWIKKRPVDYVDQELVNVKREDINSVTVSGPNETYVLKPGGDDKTVVLENLHEGKKLKSDVADKVFTALADLRFDDVNTETSRQDLRFDGRYTCRLNDSTAYTFSLAKQGESWYAKCDAEFTDKTPVTKTQGEVETEEELKRKEAKLLARDAAENFAEKHKGWAYLIPSYQAENLTKPLADLLEHIAKEQTQAASEPNQAG